MKKTHFLRLSAAMLMLAGSSVMAQTISEQAAKDKAYRFMSSNQTMRKAAARGQQTLNLAYTSKADGETHYYVFNQPGGGFVIVGGDEAAQEILGYSSFDSFDYETLPDGMKWLLQYYDESISHAISQVKSGQVTIDATGVAKASMREASRYDVYPLLGAGQYAIQYDQGSPYNLAIDGGQGQFLTGCVTTAAVQVMAQWKCPRTDAGLKFSSMSIADGGCYGTAPEIIGPYTYDWNSIQPNYSSSQKYNLNDPNVKDLATLMYRVSRAVHAEYGVKATGASVRDLGKVMIENFGYDKGLLHQQRKNYDDASWEQMVYDEVAAGRSVIFSGEDVYGGGGHAFVCDGYNALTNNFHINWGWGGYCDSYFALSGANALAPHGTGSGGAGTMAAYNKGMEALVGIEPLYSANYIYNMWAEDLSLNETEINKGKAVTLNGILWNNSYCDYNAPIGLGFFEEGVNEGVISMTSFDYELKSFEGTGPVSVAMPETLVAGKRYRVVPYYMEGDSWRPFLLDCKVTTPVFTVKEEDRSTKAYCMPWKMNASIAEVGGQLTTSVGGFGNDGDFAADIIFGFKFTNVNDMNDFAYSESWTLQSLPAGYFADNMPVNIPGVLFPGQTYQVTAVYRADDGSWQPCRKDGDFSDPQVKLTQPTNLIVVQAPLIGFDYQVTPGTYTFKAVVMNPTSKTLRKDLVVWLDYQSVLYNTYTFAPGEQKEISCSLDLSAFGNHPLSIDIYSENHEMFSTTVRVVKQVVVNKDLNGDQKVSVSDIVVFNNQESMQRSPDLNMDGKLDDKDRQVIVKAILSDK